MAYYRFHDDMHLFIPLFVSTYISLSNRLIINIIPFALKNHYIILLFIQ